jgi:Fe-S cluster assembly protein SufD
MIETNNSLLQNLIDGFSPEKQSDTIKSEAFEKLKNLGFPTTKNEEWKYTNLSNLVSKPFQIAAGKYSHQTTTAQIKRFRLESFKANELVLINGVFIAEASKTYSPAHELEILSFQDAKKLNHPLFSQHFSKYAQVKDGFSAANTAFAEDGYLIHVPKGKEPELPLVIHHITDSSFDNILVQPRLLIVLGENAGLKVVEMYNNFPNGNADTTNLSNGITEIFLEKSSRCSHYKIHNDESNCNHVGTVQVRQLDKSVFNSFAFTLQGGLVRNNLNIEIDGQYAECHMNGLYLCRGNMLVDNHTFVNHLQPNSESNELYKGVIDGKATGVFNGKIYVSKDAQKTNAFQSNRNILLSPEGSIYTKPQLEIFADDVKCSHGTTTGQLDSEALFYLRARGLSEEAGKALLLKAFVNEVVETVDLEPLKQYLEAEVERWFGNL